MVDVVPSGANTCRAVAGSRKTIVAPAIGAPNCTSPTTVTVRTSPPSTTDVVSPMDSPEASRVLDSGAISSGPAGARPATTLTLGSAGSSAIAKLGGPLPLAVAVPSAPTRTTGPDTSGTACATPSTCGELVRQGHRDRVTGLGGRVAAGLR